jgi:sortase A
MRQVLGATGRVLVTVGILLLLFTAYQLWGTGIYEARAQGQLEDQFHELKRRHAGARARTTATTTTTPSASTSSVPPTTTAAPVPLPESGDAVAHISVPKIGLDAYVVEGVDVADLRKGPGHYPGTPLPGQEGNAAIAGHRTTYGAPFSDLDQLAAGDQMELETLQGAFRYRVDRAPFVVDPDDREVLQSRPDPARQGRDRATLTLTTCNPKYSAAERLVVTATLIVPGGAAPLPATVGTTPKRVAAVSGLSGEDSSNTPALVSGVIAAVVGALWWLVFHRHPSWATWIVGAIPFLVVLFVFYTYLERALPANY